MTNLILHLIHLDNTRSAGFCFYSFWFVSLQVKTSNKDPLHRFYTFRKYFIALANLVLNFFISQLHLKVCIVHVLDENN